MSNDYVNHGGSDTKGERPNGTGPNYGESAHDVHNRTPRTPDSPPTFDRSKGYAKDLPVPKGPHGAYNHQ